MRPVERLLEALLAGPLRWRSRCSPRCRNRPSPVPADRQESNCLPWCAPGDLAIVELPHSGMPGLPQIARTVDRAARVVDHVGAGVLVPGRIGFDHIPVEDGEHFVEAGKAVQVSAVEVGVAAVAVADVGGHEGKPGLVVLRDTVAILVEEGPRVEILSPLVDGDISHIDGWPCPRGPGW